MSMRRFGLDLSKARRDRAFAGVLVACGLYGCGEPLRTTPRASEVANVSSSTSEHQTTSVTSGGAGATLSSEARAGDAPASSAGQAAGGARANATVPPDASARGGGLQGATSRVPSDPAEATAGAGGASGGDAVGGGGTNSAQPSGNGSSTDESSIGQTVTDASGSERAMGGLSREQVVRIMATGDSITETGCWRRQLWDMLAEAGYQVDLVGSKNNEGDCGSGWDADNEGHSGALVTEMASSAAAWAQANPADVVLFHWGTNDVWHAALPIEAIVEAYSMMVAGFRLVNPNVILLIAQIIPVAPEGPMGVYPERTRQLNERLEAWAAAQTTEQSPLLLVDQWTGFPSDGAPDGVHPYAESGSRHLADNWFAAIAALY